MELNRTLILFIVFLVGVIIPFIPSLTVIEMFFLLIPFAFIFIATAIYLIVSLLKKNINSRKALFIFLILPIFISSQLASGFTVNKIQRFRSENMIKEAQKIRTETGEFPEKLNSSVGINYQRLNDKNNFVISYSRGFMVTEKYDSVSERWKSYGWND